MSTPRGENLPNTERRPDYQFFGGKAVSWKMVSEAGWEGRLGRLEPGFDETFPSPVPESGERIWLHEPKRGQELEVIVLDSEEHEVSSHYLYGEGVKLHIEPGYFLNLVARGIDEPILYLCDYPGVEPSAPVFSE